MDNFQVLDLSNLTNGVVIYEMRSPREKVSGEDQNLNFGCVKLEISARQPGGNMI